MAGYDFTGVVLNGTPVLGNSAIGTLTTGSSHTLSSTQVRLGTTAANIIVANSSSPLLGIERYYIEYTVPNLSSGPFVTESSQTVAGLTTNSVLVWQHRLSATSTAGFDVQVRCSTEGSLGLRFVAMSASSINGSTQSGYLLQFRF